MWTILLAPIAVILLVIIYLLAIVFITLFYIAKEFEIVSKQTLPILGLVAAAGIVMAVVAWVL